MATSKITAFKCDRCGERGDVPENVDRHSHGWHRIDRFIQERPEDLCQKCWKSLEVWWAGT